MDNYLYHCPKCGSADLRILCEIVADLRTLKADVEGPRPVEGATCTWNDDSWTVCQACGNAGPARAFEKGR